ncbi:MAG: dihydrolipoyl dehydrogenase [Bacillota bacterium]
MFDLAVIGGGPAGYAAAVRAAQKGARVALIESDRLGGTCLNRGCIPTKALLQTAEIYAAVRRASAFGVKVSGVELDYGAAVDRKDAVVDGLVKGLEQLMKARRVEVLAGRGEIPQPGRVRVAGPGGAREIEAGRLIIATGSRAVAPPVPGIGSPLVLDSNRALAVRDVPPSLAVIGGGVIGIEMATLFAGLGSSVTVVEVLPEILPGVDRELKQRLALLLKRSGIAIRVSTRVAEVWETDEGRVLLRLSETGGSESVLEAHRVLLAAGRTPNFGGIDLERLGVAHSRAGIKVDRTMATSVPGIWAAGDVIGGLLLAHVAMHEGLTAADNALGGAREADYESVPYCIFSRPELAGVGLTEDRARERGVPYAVGRFPFSANGKAQVQGEKDGLVKVLAGEDGRVLGVHILGPHASELIHEGALAVRLGARVGDLAHMLHAHPTLSEALGEAAHDVTGEAVHLLPRKERPV